jgi:hypothetical protein
LFCFWPRGGGDQRAIYGGVCFFAGFDIKGYNCIFILFSQGLQSLQETEESFKRGAELMAEGQFDRALNECMETLNKLDAILCPPYRDYIQCQEGARRCMLTMGNTNFLNGLDN